MLRIYLLTPFVAATLAMVLRSSVDSTVVNVPDAFENILYGFYIANGWTAYSQFASNHLPGVYLYLGGIFSLFGARGAVPSHSLLATLGQLSVFATLWFQLACAVSALRGWGKRPIVVLGAVAIVVGARYLWNASLPLSETYHLFLFLLWPILLHQAFMDVEAKRRVSAAAFLLLPFWVLSLFLGMTSVPTTLWSALLAFFVLVADRTHLRSAAAPAAGGLLLTALVALSIARNCDWGLLYFFNVPFNLVLQPANGSPLFHFPSPWLGVTLLMLFALAGIAKRGAKGRRFALFCGGVAVGAWLMTWRVAAGYKTMGLWGIHLGLLILILRQGPRISVPWLRGGRVFQVVSVVLLAVGTFSFVRHVRFPPTAPRLAGLDAANVCRFQQSHDCRCLRETIWDPFFYLSQDVRQCAGWGLWNALIGLHPKTQRDLENDLRSDRVAFLLEEKERWAPFRFPESAATFLQDHKHCETTEGHRRICY